MQKKNSNPIAIANKDIKKGEVINIQMDENGDITSEDINILDYGKVVFGYMIMKFMSERLLEEMEEMTQEI